MFLKEFFLYAFLLFSEEVATKVLLSLFDALLAYAFDYVCLNYSPFFLLWMLSLFIFVLFALLFTVLT